jgi:hypothetical protein
MLLFYNYYKKRQWVTTPHFRTLISTSFLVWINATSIACFLNKENFFLGGSKELFLLKFLSTLTILMFLFNTIGNKKELDSLTFDRNQTKRGNLFLILYVIVSIAIMVLGIIYASKK